MWFRPGYTHASDWSHHHGIGKLKAPVLNKVWGGTRRIYNQVRRGIDPDGILNPKKKEFILKL